MGEFVSNDVWRDAAIPVRGVHAVGADPGSIKVVRHLRSLPWLDHPGPLGEAARQALAAAASDPTSLAAEPVLRLVEELERRNLGESVPAARALITQIRAPGGMDRALRATIARALLGTLDVQLAEVRTFSLVLFTEHCHGGRIAASFRQDRGQWSHAMSPPTGTPDHHLALIVDPAAHRTVDAIARRLGVEADMPCVLFLGDAPIAALESPRVLVRWGVRRLGPGDIFTQLKATYRTAYAQHGRLPGEPLASAFDRLYRSLVVPLNPWSWLEFVGGALGGKPMAEAVAASREALEP
ncbi:MAG: hypothetical protein R3F60_11125 [bacterium]